MCVLQRGETICVVLNRVLFTGCCKAVGEMGCVVERERESVCRLMVGLVRIAHLYPVDLKMSLVDSGVAL